MPEYNPSNLPEYLHAYYQFLFPHNLFYQWLSYGNDKDYFERREFSLCLPGDIYLRFNSFDTLADMRKSIVSRLPTKIDLGAVYNIKPKDSKKTKVLCFQPVERELVFDIDMTDYDDVRNCCSGAEICEKCWTFMTVAARILEAFLREDFGFENLLWVYSGRRGIHCWVADERARRLKNDARDAIANFINIFDGGQFKAKKIEIDGLRGIHPSIKRSVKIIDDYFDDLMIEKQDFLDTKDHIETIINLCQDAELKDEMKLLYDSKLKNTSNRWSLLVKLCQNYYRPSNLQANKRLNRHKYLLEEIKLQLCYPRLDINVSKGLNHLLKVPFSVHPKTGRVCVPIDFSQIDSFDPFKVPSVEQLCQQLDQLNLSKNNDENADNNNVDGSIDSNQKACALSTRISEKTELSSALNIFRSFIKNIEAKYQGTLIVKSDEKLDF